jgi:glycosyltransferase involved in cell wall biosynthesis
VKIAVYTIVKNEEQFIKRWSNSCKDADLRLIVDTGSTDNTVSLAEQNGCTVGHIKVDPWRFDHARNAALNLIPQDYDYCIALDADEVLVEGWREALEKIDPNVTRPRYKYVWSWNPDGTEGLVYSGDKIHARKNYYWHHPVHEVLKSNNGEIQSWVDIEIRHYPDHSKSRSQYLPLLEIAVEEDPNDDRNRFYLGRELMFNNRKQEAKEHLLEHLKLSTWKPERATSMRYLSRVTPDRLEWLLRACAEAPDRREPWVELSQFYYDTKNWAGCYFATKQALSITEKPLEYLCEADAWGSLPWDLNSIGAWHISIKKEAIYSVIKALEIMGHDDRLIKNLDFMYRDSRTTEVEVIIPFKSNIEGLKNVISSLQKDPAVKNIHVICDGDQAYDRLFDVNYAVSYPLDVHVSNVSNIHHMWNIGLEYTQENRHVAFINDDVSIGDYAISICASTLDNHPELGLISPNYDNRKVNHSFIEVDTTCRGRYDGTGGIGGFCMVLRSEIASSWSFDTSMKWWYGDDDLVKSVKQNYKAKAAISTIAKCSDNESWTIVNDPPANFGLTVLNDRKIFEEKWNLK